jgi:sec-independent protein translocase protein TatA
MPIIGGGHIVYIILLLVVVLIIFGPGKLPDIGAGAGKAIREFRKASTEARDHVVKAAAGEKPSATEASAPPAAAPTNSAPPADPVGSVSTPAGDQRQPG